MKVTKKYLTDWIKEKMTEMVSSKITFTDLLVINKNLPPSKGFVPRLIFVFDNGVFPIYVYGYFSMEELTDHINRGYALEWKIKNNMLAESEIGLSKTKINQSE